ncbi:hypothetical protein CDAR_469911 [Caerostris darwini]|uniref:Uncharacterized protein n=1 Tax=Caerostris darwini TaxID=1538125 RepID=A0AAV4VCP9_9ARAC|nr:hypothetical protein CDAR_469911 [Caerostris darwini]
MKPSKPIHFFWLNELEDGYEKERQEGGGGCPHNDFIFFTKGRGELVSCSSFIHPASQIHIDNALPGRGANCELLTQVCGIQWEPGFMICVMQDS